MSRLDPDAGVLREAISAVDVAVVDVHALANCVPSSSRYTAREMERAQQSLEAAVEALQCVRRRAEHDAEKARG